MKVINDALIFADDDFGSKQNNNQNWETVSIPERNDFQRGWA